MGGLPGLGRCLLAHGFPLLADTLTATEAFRLGIEGR
jgi:hypothetical protein